MKFLKVNGPNMNNKFKLRSRWTTEKMTNSHDYHIIFYTVIDMKL